MNRSYASAATSKLIAANVRWRSLVDSGVLHDGSPVSSTRSLIDLPDAPGPRPGGVLPLYGFAS